MAATDIFFRGGAYTLLAQGTAATDGDFNFEGNTYAISAVADGTGGKILVTCADFGTDITVDSKVTISGTTIYDGTHVVTDVPSTTTFKVTETWVDTRTGNAEAHRTSNWVDENGVGTHKPITATDKVFLTELADRVPSTYSNSSYPHTAGGHWCITDNLDQSALDVNGFFVSAGYEGHIYGYNSDTLDAAAAVDKGSDQVGIPSTGHPFSTGDYVTLGGTANYNGEYKVVSKTANEFIIDHVYYVETFATTDTATGKTPLQISIAGSGAYDMIIESDGTFYIECGSTTPNIPELIFNSTSGLLHISSEAANANWDDIRVTGGGTLNIAPDTYFTKLTTTGEAEDANVIVGTGCIGPEAASCDLDCFGGTIAWDSKIGDVEQHAGTITYCQNVDTGTTVDIDKWLGYGGTFNWYGKGSLKDYEQWNGTIKALGDGAKTIGSGASAYPQNGGTFDLSQATGPVSFFAGASIDHKGGELKPAKRTNVSW